jgi:tRNA U34 2-thiouridine synthase MnmA/TrmU
VTVVDGTTIGLVLETAVRAITPGQSGVLFDPADRVLGGGVIS